MAGLGFGLQVLILIGTLSATVVYFLALSSKSEKMLKIGNGIFITSTCLAVLSSFVLLYALATSDFSIKYVVSYTDRSLPMAYKLSAFWAGQSGSLLMWLLLLCILGSVEIFRLKDKSFEYRTAVYLACAVSVLFFAFLTTAIQNPFEAAPYLLKDGNGMNPMLQNPGMIIHPPMLYIGYIGFNVVIAHAFGSLYSGDLSSMWIKSTRAFAVVTWVFLTAGIVIGGWWAYMELGWGGYWAWDAVENSSLFPWFIATAYLHSSYIYELRNKFKPWSYILILLTFQLTILGTFITRSGLIESVHSFGANPIGKYFIFFIVITSIIFFVYLYKNRKGIEDKAEFKYLSREGIFFIANWIFVGITVVTLFGTFLPWFSEILTDQKMTVGVTYFNKVSIPFFMAILIASGIAPLVPFSDKDKDKFFSRLIPSALVMVVSIIVAYMLGYKLVTPLLLIGFTLFSCSTIVIKSFQVIIKGGIRSLLTANRFFGAMIIHFGVVVLAFGVIMSSFYNEHLDEIMPEGAVTQMGRYKFEIGKITIEKIKNYKSAYIPIKVFKDDKYLASGYPEMRQYDNRNYQDNNFAEVSTYSMFHGDLYFIFSNYDLEAKLVRVQFIFQPFVSWIWVGCALMMLGGVYGIFRFRKKQQ